MAEDAEIDLRGAVRGRAEGRSNVTRGIEFDDMPLAVVERERVALITIADGESEAGRGIESAAQEADCFRWGTGHLPRL